MLRIIIRTGFRTFALSKSDSVQPLIERQDLPFGFPNRLARIRSFGARRYYRRNRHQNVGQHREYHNAGWTMRAEVRSEIGTQVSIPSRLTSIGHRSARDRVHWSKRPRFRGHEAASAVADSVSQFARINRIPFGLRRFRYEATNRSWRIGHVGDVWHCPSRPGMTNRANWLRGSMRRAELIEPGRHEPVIRLISTVPILRIRFAKRA